MTALKPQAVSHNTTHPIIAASTLLISVLSLCYFRFALTGVDFSSDAYVSATSASTDEDQPLTCQPLSDLRNLISKKKNSKQSLLSIIKPCPLCIALVWGPVILNESCPL